MLVNQQQKLQDEIQVLVARHGRSRAALMPVLQALQERHASVSDFAMQVVAGRARDPTFHGRMLMIMRRMWPKEEFVRNSLLELALGYVFHIGLFIVVLFFLPHILFIKDITGLAWPNLPNGVIFFVGAITVAALFALLMQRIMTPVKRLLSNFDDYFSWFVTTAPLITGLLASAHVGARYETLLAIHLLTVALLFVWLPFGKLFHTVMVFVSRGATGGAFERKGAAI